MMRKRTIWIAMGVALSLIWSTSWGGSIFSMGQTGFIVEGLDAKARAMGGDAIALIGSDHFGRGNPALLGALSKVGLHMTFAEEQWEVKDDSGQEGKFTEGRLRAFRFGVPIGYGTVLSAGIFPYSEVHFDLADSATVDALMYDRRIRGSGGIRSISLEAGKRFGERLFWGICVHHIFGSIEETYSRDFRDPVMKDTKDILRRSHEGWRIGAGAVYKIGKRWSLGGVYIAKANLHRTTTTETLFEAESEQSMDMDLPASVALGIAAQATQKLVLHSDFKITFFEGLYEDENTRNALDLSVGVEVLPARDLADPYYRRIPLRLGFRWRRLPYLTGPKAEGIDEASVGCGFGLPLAEQRGILDVSFEAGKRGHLSENGAEEVFYRQTVSFSGWEKWFERKGK